MKSTDTNPHNTQMRRKDRAVNDEEWIKDFLKQAPFGVLAMSVGDQPYAKNNLFAYDEDTNAIFIHGATVGRTPETIRANPHVCFTTAEMGRLLPADQASEVSVEFASVVVFGLAHILEEEKEMIHGLQLLMDKYFPKLRPGKHYTALDGKQTAGTAVYRIDIQGWSGKQKQVDSDFPGAFFFQDSAKESVQAMSGPTRKFKVRLGHIASSNTPLIAKRGDRLKFERKETEWLGWIWCQDDSGTAGWAPENWVIPEHGICKFKYDYNARELTLSEGDDILVTHFESGWAWGKKQDGESGWAPLSCLEEY